jgi:hypothetical protein
MNKEKLIVEVDEIADFEENWDGYGAGTFSKKTIDKVKVVIDCLDDKYPDPDVVPNVYGIQLEWDYGKNALEVDIGESEEDRVSYLKVLGTDMEDWTETTITDLSEINDLLKWLYGDCVLSDVDQKIKEMEARIEKLEQQMEETVKKPNNVYPGSAYDLSKRPDLRQRGRKKWRK